MQNSMRWLILTAAVLIGLLGPIAQDGKADTLYGITFSNQLITINPVTGAGALVGNLDSSMLGYGLSVRNGNLYTYDQQADLIRQLDPATGHTIASINIGAGNLVGEGDLAFRSDGIGFLSTVGIGGTSILTFNITVPNSSLVSPEDFLFDGLAFNSADVLYGFSQGISSSGSKLYTIDQTTGALTLIGALNTPSASDEVLGGLAFRSDGSLWASLSNDGTSTLVTVNGATGQATPVGSIAGFGNVSGIAFLGTPVQTPEPDSLVLMALGFVGLFGLSACRSRKGFSVLRK